MARVSDNYSAFTAGELTPRLRGRTDLKLYKKGCKTLENMYVLPQGGATKRPGTYYISTAYNSNYNVRLIPFRYSETDSYILEFGHRYIRFYKDGGIILSDPASAGIPYKITTPYSGAYVKQLKIIQTADVMYIAHENYPIYKLSRYDHNDWVLSKATFYGGPFFDQNIYEDIEIKPSAITGKNVTISVQNAVTNGKFASDLTNWTTFTSASGTVAPSAGKARIIGDGINYSGLEQQFTLDTQWATYQVKADVTNNNVVMYFSKSPSGEGVVYSQTIPSGSNTIDVPVSASDVYLGFKSKSTTYVDIDNVTLKANIFDPLHVGALWKFTGKKEVSKDVTAEDEFTNSIELDSGESVIVNLSGTWVGTVTVQRSFDSGDTWVDYYTTTSNISVEITEASDDVYYRAGIKTGDYTSGTSNILLTKLDVDGFMEISTVTNSISAAGEVKKTLPSVDSNYKWSEGAWSDFNGYPSCIAFFEQRMVAAGSPARPQTIWGSVVDDYENFTVGTNDDDSYKFTLVSSDVNTIKWMVDLSYLLCGTLGGEWRFGFSDQATTPTVVDAKRQTTYGSEDIQAQTVGYDVVYVQKGGTKLRSMFWNYEIEGFKSTDVSQMAEHLMKEKVVDMTVVDKPDPLILLVTDAGNIICSTYDRDIEVIAYSKWTTDGVFESISTIPGTDRDEIWVVVKRTIGGTDYRYIEQFQTPQWDNLEDAFYVDSGLTYDSISTNTVSGLDHLEGESVVAMGDGSALSPVTVSGGSVEFSESFNKYHIGLPYTAKLEPMDIEIGAQAGASQSKLKKPYNVSVYLLDSVGLKVGYDENHLDEVSFRTSGVPMNQAVPLFTGDKRVTFNRGFSRNQSVMVVNDQPLPFTVISIVVTLYTSDL
jgi:hypothetical protein